MSYRIRTDVFEGPFDLLLQLVSRQKVDVAAIPIAEVADQYLDSIEQMGDLDLDVSSDFLYVASTLLELKARALLPDDEPADSDDELSGLTDDQARDVLVARLLAYKQYKGAAAMLGARMEAADRMHPRTVGLEPRFLHLMPDYLEGVTLSGLAVICADIASRRETFLLEADHVATLPLSLEAHAESVRRMVRQRGRTSFDELLEGSREPAVVVVTFLAVLTLYHRGTIDMAQEETFGPLEVSWLDDPSRAQAQPSPDESEDENGREGAEGRTALADGLGDDDAARTEDSGGDADGRG